MQRTTERRQGDGQRAGSPRLVSSRAGRDGSGLGRRRGSRRVFFCLAVASGRNPQPNRGDSRSVSRIVLRVLVLEAKRTNRSYLGDVFAGLRPMEVPRIAGQNDDAATRIRLDLIAVESIAQADLENAGHNV
jgi:hypothetical protein